MRIGSRLKIVPVKVNEEQGHILNVKYLVSDIINSTL